MNKPIETPETGLVPLENINALQIFVEGDFNKLLNDVKQRALENIPAVPDMSVKADRDAIRTTAAQVAKAKTAFDAAGKELVAKWKKQAGQVDESRKFFRDAMDYFKAEIREPLTAYENEIKEKEAAEKLAQEIARDHEQALADNEIFKRAKELERREAELARKEAERVANEAEEKRIREAQEKARQDEREKVEAEKMRLLQLAAEQKAAAERAEREKKEAAEKAEADRIAAEQKAEADKLAAIEAEKKRAKDEADRLERIRLCAERKKREADEARAADLEHRKGINCDARDSIMKVIDSLGVNMPTSPSEEAFKIAQAIVEAIALGKIPNVSIKY